MALVCSSCGAQHLILCYLSLTHPRSDSGCQVLGRLKEILHDADAARIAEKRCLLTEIKRQKPGQPKTEQSNS